METSLFDWCGWDLLEPTLSQFYGCTLKVPIGKFKIGNLVPCITIDFEHGILQIYTKKKAFVSEHKIQIVLVN